MLGIGRSDPSMSSMSEAPPTPVGAGTPFRRRRKAAQTCGITTMAETLSVRCSTRQHINSAHTHWYTTLWGDDKDTPLLSPQNESQENILGPTAVAPADDLVANGVGAMLSCFLGATGGISLGSIIFPPGTDPEYLSIGIYIGLLTACVGNW